MEMIRLDSKRSLLFIDEYVGFVIIIKDDKEGALAGTEDDNKQL